MNLQDSLGENKKDVSTIERDGMTISSARGTKDINNDKNKPNTPRNDHYPSKHPVQYHKVDVSQYNSPLLQISPSLPEPETKSQARDKMN